MIGLFTLKIQIDQIAQLYVSKYFTISVQVFYSLQGIAFFI